jgi:predicted phage baseplate assembly protein
LMIFELARPSIKLWDLRYPNAIKVSDGAIYLPALGLESIEPNRTIIIDDRQIQPQTVTVTNTIPIKAGHWGESEYLKIELTQALKRDLDAGSAIMYGNVAKATHGETVSNEVLGDGDASKDFQSLALSKQPVTFVRQPNLPHGSANTLRLWVDEQEWHEVRSFYNIGKDERAFKTYLDRDNKMIVQFGEGINGARPTSGRGNITATYRQGSGRDGIVAAESLKTLLDKPLGLKSVMNPDAASGGAEPEQQDSAKKNAPRTVRTFDRIVSLIDFEEAAKEVNGIAKARSISEWDGESKVAKLVVACDEGDDLTDNIKKELIEYLDARRDMNLKVIVEDRKKVPVKIKARINLDPDKIKEKVLSSVLEALKSYFSFDNHDLGSPVHLSDVYRVIQVVDGVASALVMEFQFKDMKYNEMSARGVQFQSEEKGLPNPVQDHLFANPDELIIIVDPKNDIIIDLRA